MYISKSIENEAIQIKSRSMSGRGGSDIDFKNELGLSLKHIIYFRMSKRNVEDEIDSGDDEEVELKKKKVEIEIDETAAEKKLR